MAHSRLVDGSATNDTIFAESRRAGAAIQNELENGGFVTQWFYSVQGSQTGPVSEDEIRDAISSGKIMETDLVWREGMPQWISAHAAGLATEIPVAVEIASGPVQIIDDGPFFKASTRFRVPRGRWIGPCVVSPLAFYLYKRAKDTQAYGAHGGLVGALIAQAVSSADDMRTCDLNELPDPVRRALDPKSKFKKGGDVIVLFKDSINRVNVSGINNMLTIRVGADKFSLTTSYFKGKLRKFLAASNWVINQELTPTAGAAHGEGFGRDGSTPPRKGPSPVQRVLYIIVAIAIFVLVVYLRTMRYRR